MNEKQEGIFFGVAPINWTNDDELDLGADTSFEHCISEMALAGYQGCEVGRKFPVDQPHQLRHLLQVRGLEICNQWHSLFLTSSSLAQNMVEFRQRCEFLQQMGARVIGVSEQSGSIHKLDLPVLGNHRPQLNKEQWAVLLSHSNTLGKLAWEEYGIKLCYHQHLCTVIESDEDMLRYLDGTDSRYVHALFDCGHSRAAGGNPQQLLQKILSRVGHVHAKDVRFKVLEQARAHDWSFAKSVREGIFTVPGDGDLDTASMLKTLVQGGYHGWIVVEAEQDPAKANPFEYALHARKFIREVLAYEVALS